MPPVTQALVVPLEPAIAFDLFVRRLPEWWPVQVRSVWLAESLGCRVDARLDGTIVEDGPNGAQAIWGTFRRFNEASDVLIDWHPGSPAESATQVEIRFRAVSGGTMVELAHWNWERLGERGSFIRGVYANGWVAVFSCFAGFAVPPPTDGAREE